MVNPFRLQVAHCKRTRENPHELVDIYHDATDPGFRAIILGKEVVISQSIKKQSSISIWQNMWEITVNFN